MAMEVLYEWANAASASAQHALNGHPILAVFVSVITVYALVGIYSSLKFKLERLPYPLLGSERMHLPLSEAWQRFLWTQKGPGLIHEAHEKVITPKPVSSTNCIANDGGPCRDVGCIQFPDKIVELPALDRYSLVLPLRLLEEVKKLPPAIASNSFALQDVTALRDLQTMEMERNQALTREMAVFRRKMDANEPQHVWPCQPGGHPYAVHRKNRPASRSCG